MVIKNFRSIYKNWRKVIKFDDTEIKKYKFHQHKSPFLIKNIDINKILVPKKILFGKKDFKYFTGCKDAKKIRLLWIFLPKLVYFDEKKCTSFSIKDEKVLEMCNDIWKKVSNSIKKEFNS